ncbi:MBL fold metallo-hydrolase [Rhizobiaceae bacterium]|nr:MBL fold metallo-hydrolase [Rhizobiaceae bacterium]
MSVDRRTFLVTATAAAGAVTLLPYAALADAHSSNVFKTDAGDVTVHPVNHASVVLETPKGTIYVDPVGEVAQYADFPRPDVIFVTHEHGDHYNADVLKELKGADTPLFVNPAVMAMLPEELKSNTTALANGESGEAAGITIDAIPAYNLTEERKNFHPQGRDNGYVLGLDDFRIYLSGDTEDIPEMRALENIDLAFVCMNLPFTMAADAAASAVNEFKPTFCYPYHYRGRDDGTQDPEEFAKLVDGATTVKLGDWY